MKKALVLGILAIFAIGISNVNAQVTDDPTVKHEIQKKKPTITQGTLQNASQQNLNNEAVESTQSCQAGKKPCCSDNGTTNKPTLQKKEIEKDFNAIPPQGKKPTAPNTNDQAPTGNNNGTK